MKVTTLLEQLTKILATDGDVAVFRGDDYSYPVEITRVERRARPYGISESHVVELW